MIETLKKIYNLFNKRDRKIIHFLVFATIVMAFTQVIGIGSLMPFLAIVTNPGVIHENRWINMVYKYFDFSSENFFLMFLGLCTLGILTFGNILQIATQWMKLRFVHIRGHILSMRLLENYINKPYIFFVNENSANLGKNVLSEVKIMISGLLKPVMDILSQGMIALFIILLLLIVDVVLALSVVVLLGGVYFLIFLKIKNKLEKLGRQRKAANRERFKTTSEIFGAIKDIKLMNNHHSFMKMYEKSSLQFERTQAEEGVYGMVPNHVVATIAFGGILVIVLYLLATGGDLAYTLPIIGLYSYSIMRLRPALQAIYASISKFRFYQSSLEEIYDDLKLYSQENILSKTSNVPAEPLPFKSNLILENIYFRYPAAKRELFSGINITIEANTSVALVGPTGSGKTTLVDIILGLLSPEKGRIIIDGVPVDSTNLLNWQQNLGYVPQHIYLADNTVTNNIAFGVTEKEIDHDRVKRAAEMACIYDYIEDELPDAYNTFIGERGIRLSGGQRQRIGIARALYRDPEVLILDEATNALDGETEDHVFKAVEMIAKTKTVIIIAHRLSTVKNCDLVYFLDKGEIIAKGTYDSLINDNQRFRRFAKLAKKASDRGLPEAVII
jgi:ATP-binding cassette, subfamily B, bacterial PglK